MIDKSDEFLENYNFGKMSHKEIEILKRAVLKPLKKMKH